ncbi:MAG: peptide-methionine (R)-S-oxide reductase MsrB [Nakamurella sp.]
MASDTAGPNSPTVVKSDDEWRAVLSPDAYAVLRQAATERPFVGEYTNETAEGTYVCRACGAELFTSREKFTSHCGWPSFYAPSDSANVTTHHDTALGMDRVEVRCRACDSHLGHIFTGEGYPTPTDERFCINSIALKLNPAQLPLSDSTGK